MRRKATEKKNIGRTSEKIMDSPINMIKISMS